MPLSQSRITTNSAQFTEQEPEEAVPVFCTSYGPFFLPWLRNKAKRHHKHRKHTKAKPNPTSTGKAAFLNHCFLVALCAKLFCFLLFRHCLDTSKVNSP